jgi:hypothetical protein
MAKHMIPNRLDISARKGIVLNFGFLYAEDIRSMLGKPRNNAVESFANGIDVPSCYLHSETGRVGWLM